MAIETFINAMSPPRVMGVRLKPYCLGHYINMRDEGCAYASDTATTLSDYDSLDEFVNEFLTGVSICACTYEEYKGYKENPEPFIKWLDAWRVAIDEAVKDPYFNLFDRMYDFQMYLKDGSEVPEFYTDGAGDGGKSGVHWSESVPLVLMADLHYSETDVYNMSLRKAFHLYVQYNAKMGLCQIRHKEKEFFAENTFKLTPCPVPISQ